MRFFRWFFKKKKEPTYGSMDDMDYEYEKYCAEQHDREIKETERIMKERNKPPAGVS